MNDSGLTARSLFTQAISLPEPEQVPFVEMSDAPASMKREVLKLLKFHHIKDDEFLEPEPVNEWNQSFKRVGEYDIESRIAAGGMGVVFMGRDSRLNRRVAIKVLPPYLNDLPEARNRLIHEAKVAAKLQHHGIVPVFDVVITDSVVAVVSQYIDGKTVDDLLRSNAEEAPLSAGDAVELVRSVAQALQHAHDAGVVHRDLKPSNILIDSATRNPKITDFGIAKLLTQTEVLHTSAGAGTCYYMSPEQTRESSDGVGPTSDIFSLGIVFYQLLTGKRPFDGPTRETIIESIRKGEVPAPRSTCPTIARDLELICLKMLEVDPGYRYRSCTELVQDLDRYIEGKPVLASPPSLGRRTQEMLLTRRQMLVRAGLLTAGVSGGAWVASRFLDTRSLLNINTGSAFASVRVLHWIPSEFRFEQVDRGSGWRHAAKLSEGMYRVVVEYAGTLREFDRYVEAQPISINSTPIAGESVLSNMTRVEPLRQVVDVDGGSNQFHELIQHVKPFMIDRTEVSNKEYREFVLATGHSPPPIWPEAYSSAWDDLPVCMVSAEDACAYAEWRGKRLPTYPEWQLMARGSSADLFPWGNERPTQGSTHSTSDWSTSLGNWGKDDMRPKMTQQVTDEIRDYFLRNAWPVHQLSLDSRTWENSTSHDEHAIKNLLGNVSEWTSTPFAWRDASGLLIVSYRSRFICGQPWAEPGGWSSKIDLTGIATDVVDQFILGRGFRCAMSII